MKYFSYYKCQNVFNGSVVRKILNTIIREQKIAHAKTKYVKVVERSHKWADLTPAW